MVVAAGCGAARRETPTIDRAFAVDWHDRASSVAIAYTARRLTLRNGRWSAEVTVHNGTGKPLYEAEWEPPGSNGVTWNGPALVYSGLDVLGNRRLIYLPADSEQPKTPFPLRNGATWRGTIGGRLPTSPPLPRRRQIWLRYPLFGVGQPSENSQLPPVQWISEKAIEL